MKAGLPRTRAPPSSVPSSSFLPERSSRCSLEQVSARHAGSLADPSRRYTARRSWIVPSKALLSSFFRKRPSSRDTLVLNFCARTFLPHENMRVLRLPASGRSWRTHALLQLFLQLAVRKTVSEEMCLFSGGVEHCTS